MLISIGCSMVKARWKAVLKIRSQTPVIGCLFRASENLQNPASSAVGFEFRKENGSEPLRNSTYTPMKEEVKYIEKPAPKITEIRIFFDNGTYQVFKPES